ncbi:MAG: response regulator [Acidobacteria bacterium]|nr:response regulator [Acidobacteriota bacterium]
MQENGTHMKSKRNLLHQLRDENLSISQRAQARCQLAIQFETEGDYEAARQAMAELWQRVGERPLLDRLDEETRGAVLLRAGVLTGWLGSARQISGAQEIAKDLITESIEIFEALQQSSRVAEGQIELACCYWREGKFDEGRILLNEALRRLSENDIQLRAKALIRSAIIEAECKRYGDALKIHTEAAPLFQQLENHCLIGSFHNEYAIVLRNLGTAEKRQDYLDLALIEYAAASYHFEEAGHLRYQACVENNLAFLLWKLGRFTEAHQHLDRAQILFARLKDDLHSAQVDETRARVMLGEGVFVQAEKSARKAVQLLDSGDADSLLAEALTTHGVALSRLGHKDQARTTFERAIRIAEQGGDLESAGLAALTLIEELPEQLSDDELFAILERADGWLATAQNAALLIRQKNCFRHLSSRLLWPALPTSLEKSVLRYEARLILRALELTGGVIRQAARLLELTHQGLQKILNNRHKDLQSDIGAIKERKRGNSRSEGVSGGLDQDDDCEVQVVTILYVEDNQTVAEAVKETLEIQGWQVETCADGNTALERISSDTEYDALLVDYDLPGMNGLELVSRARKLAHRAHTPIVVLSATPVRSEARQAGADAFLRKPQDVGSIVETIARLVAEHEQDG